MKGIVALLGVLISVSCCTWEGFVTSSVDTLTRKEMISAHDFMHDMFYKPAIAPIEIKNFQGVRTTFPGFINYYLHYNAEKDFVLDLISSMPASPSFDVKSDERCYKTDNSIDSFFSTGDDTSTINFWHPEKVKNKEFYKCLKYPWKHTIIFDMDSDIVFHVIVEIRD